MVLGPETELPPAGGSGFPAGETEAVVRSLLGTPLSTAAACVGWLGGVAGPWVGGREWMG